MMLNSHYFILLGASACVELNQFEEAIAWCDKGLAVSFTLDFCVNFENQELLWYFFCHGPCKLQSKKKKRNTLVLAKVPSITASSATIDELSRGDP